MTKEVQPRCYETLKEIARNLEWNPHELDENGEPSLTPHKEINTRKIVTAVKKLMINNGDITVLQAITKDTEYMTLKGHPLGSLILYVSGHVSANDLLEATKQGKQENKLYPYQMDKGIELLDTLVKVSEDIWAIRESGVLDIDVSKLDFTMPSDTSVVAEVDNLLSSVSFPKLNEINYVATQNMELVKAAEDKAKEEVKRTRDALNKVDEYKSAVTTLQMQLSTSNQQQDYEVEGDGTIPSGKSTQVKATDVFKGVKLNVDFEVPVFDWDGVHPDVPKVDPNYIFRVTELTRVLYAIVTNQRAYLHGHTGTGKTTLIEQVCAHLNYPFIRVNFDSEVTRMDLIGRDTLSTDEEGNTVSKFVDGILPRAMASPCILCCDEIDFVRPDVAYVMQAALEGNGLRITEDGDRQVRPDSMFRMFATGNTVGQGDEHGMYQGARPQSMALLDRFTVWANVDYLTKKQRKDLVFKHYPALSEEDQSIISDYTNEHLEAFKSSKVMQPISPRGILSIAKATVILGDVKQALSMCVLDRANAEDYSVLKGLVDRVA